MIEICNLSKEYILGNEKIFALKNVNLNIQNGAFISITGRSGSGKSTLMNILGGLDSVTRGSILIDGECITDMKEKKLSVYRRKNIGFVFQFFNLISELNAHENIIFPALLDKTEIDEEYYEKIITILDLKDRLNHLPNQLSGGQQQRVAIARALILKPKIILLDEPTGNLDEASSNAVITMLCKLRHELKQTMIIVTHDTEIAHMTENIITLNDGQICIEK